MEPSQEHHSTEQELRQHRLDKLARIRARGDEPFKYRFERSARIAEARSAFEEADSAASQDNPAQYPATLAGRITAFRSHGKSAFADLCDDTGKIQVFFGLKQIGEDAYEALKDLDIGDFLGVDGLVKRTRRGEMTLFAESYTLLAKSLRALPEKYHGLTDVETRYRQRYLDMVANP
jgi:lysyl-tRNA synthetase, class II